MTDAERIKWLHDHEATVKWRPFWTRVRFRRGLDWEGKTSIVVEHNEVFDPLECWRLAVDRARNASYELPTPPMEKPCSPSSPSSPQRSP